MRRLLTGSRFSALSFMPVVPRPAGLVGPAAAVAVAALLASAGTAHASILNWNNAGGGAAATSTNWSPAQAPAAADDLVFNLLSNYSVSYAGAAASSRTHVYKRGTVTITLSIPHTTSTGLTVGDVSGDSATAVLTGGAWTVQGSSIVGDASGSTGTLNINDDDADLLLSGAASDLTVGNSGAGSLNVTGGGLVEVPDQFIIGANSTSVASATISGATSGLPVVRSTLRVPGTSQSRIGAGGDATLSVALGAVADFAGDLVVANGSASTSSVTVAGLGGLVPAPATLDVAGDLLLGRNISAAVAAGTATMTVNADGRVVVGDTLFIGGDADGGTGTLNLNTDGLVEAVNVAVGSSAGGTLSHGGGTLKINGGTFTGHADPLVVTGTGAPTLQLTSSLSKTIAPAGALALVIGDDSGVGTFSGTLLIDGGADLIVSGTSKDVNIGDDAGTTGTITVEGAGSRLVADQPGDDLRVGNNGNGTLEIFGGGQVLAQNVIVPAVSGGDGLVLMDDPGSSLTAANLTIGHASGTGAGTVNNGPGTVVTATGTGTSIVVRDTGALWVSGQLNCSGTILLSGGDLDVHGSVSAETMVDVEDGGRLRAGAAAAAGVVDGPVRVRAGGLVEASANDLTIGDAGDANGFLAEDGSVVSVVGRTLTVHDQNRARFDAVTMSGGAIVAPSGMEIFTPGTNGTLDGTGTITTSELFMESGGSVITATGTNGITIVGKFRNNSGLIDGTKFTFNHNPAISDSGWTGAGTIDAQVVFNSGTEVNALANMTMGDGSNFGVTFNAGSELHADTRTVTLLDGNGLGLPSVTDLNGGRIVCAQNLVVNTGRRLSGRGGSIDAPIVRVFGTLSPGELTGVALPETGELAINGDLDFAASDATTDIEIGGLLGPMQYDRVTVNGDATLAGTLNVSFINGFTPSYGDTWIVMSYDAAVGTFDTINVQGGSFCGAKAFVTPTEVIVSVGLSGDVDDDRDVDLTDLSMLLVEFGCTGAVEFPCPIDFNFDGDTNLSDLSLLLANFGLSCP